MQLTSSFNEAPPVMNPDQGSRPMRILMVAANLDSRFGGVSSVLGPLCANIQKGGSFTVSIAAFAENDENLSPIERFAPVNRYPLRGIGSLLAPEPRSLSGQTLPEQIRNSDLVHIHGLWQEHCASAAALARRLEKPYVISAHGMLDPWALKHKGWKKSLYLRLIEQKNLAEAAALHALTEAEAGDYRSVTTYSVIETIPNAVDLPQSADPDLFLSTYPTVKGKAIVIFLSRLHRKKGLDLLSEAWKRVAPDFPDAHLVIAGPDSEQLRPQLEADFEARNLLGSVTFTGMLSGAMKWSALSAAHVFVLPSRSEGLSMAALEAMGMGKPVILTEQCHVDQLVTRDCGWQIQPDACELEAALRDYFRSPQRAREMGKNARQLVEARHSWEVVGDRMRVFYERLVRSHSPLSQPV